MTFIRPQGDLVIYFFFVFLFLRRTENDFVEGETFERHFGAGIDREKQNYYRRCWSSWYGLRFQYFDKGKKNRKLFTFTKTHCNKNKRHELSIERVRKSRDWASIRKITLEPISWFDKNIEHFDTRDYRIVNWVIIWNTLIISIAIALTTMFLATG